MKHVQPPFTALYPASVPCPNKFITSQSPVLRLVDLVLFYHQLEHVIVAKQQYCGISHLDRFLVLGKTHRACVYTRCVKNWYAFHVADDVNKTLVNSHVGAAMLFTRSVAPPYVQHTQYNASYNNNRLVGVKAVGRLQLIGVCATLRRRSAS